MTDFLDIFNKKKISETSKKLYIQNIKRLNGNQDIKNLNFLNNSSKIFEKIKDKSKNTQRTYLISVVSLLKELPEKKYKKLYDIYYKILMEFNKELKDNTEKTEKQKDNWISQDELKEIYEDTKEKATPNLLSNRKKDATPDQWETILKYFILSLYYLQSPRRNKDFLEMYIIKKYNDDLDKTFNYYSVDDKTFHFCNYKTKGTYQTQNIKLNDDMENVMNEYLLNHPMRKEIKKLNDKVPLLVYANGEKLKSSDVITRLLNKIFKKKVGSSMMRNMYLTNKYADLNKEKQMDAQNMGTSSGTIDSNYVKLD